MNPLGRNLRILIQEKEMLKSVFLSFALLLSGTMLACNKAAASVVAIPDPALDETIRNTSQKQTIVLAGGCFWGVDAVFKHVKLQIFILVSISRII